MNIKNYKQAAMAIVDQLEELGWKAQATNAFDQYTVVTNCSEVKPVVAPFTYLSNVAITSVKGIKNTTIVVEAK